MKGQISWESDMPKFSGQCMCGDNKFEGEGEPMFIGNCHCEDCRKSSGAAYSTFVFLNKEDMKMTGKTSTYQHKADSGNILTKHFCPRCGSPMYTENEIRPTMIGLRAGVINEQENIKPTMNVFTSNKIDSTPLDPDLAAFDKMPG